MKNLATSQNIKSLLIEFVEKRPGLSYADYGNSQAYNSDYREILKDKHSFYELLNYAQRSIDNLDEKLFNNLSKTSGRLSIEKDQLTYITGQYFPTEYRNAACRVLVEIIWNNYRDQNSNADGFQIRKDLKSKFSSRNTKLYFA